MAYYDNAPRSSKGRKTVNARRSYTEEGEEFKRGSKGPGESRTDRKPSNTRDGEKVRSFRDVKPGTNRDKSRFDREEDRRSSRRDRQDRSQERKERSPMREERPVRSFRDSEYIPASPAMEENLPPENLLAGRNPIREALKAGRDIEKLLVQKGELTGSAREIVQMAREMHIVVQEVEHQRLDQFAKNHQGMIAFASAYQYSTVEEMLAEAKAKGEAPFLILLDGITDPHNLGAIIRSAECVGAHGVIVPERRSVGLTPAAVKASAGAVEHMKVARVVNLSRVIEELKEKNIWTYALTMDGEDYERVNFKGGVALVVGSEGEGISRLVLESCDQKVSLPMAGQLDSLNASVAAGVVMYRVLSGRRK